jgi:dihydrofolate reductase
MILAMTDNGVIGDNNDLIVHSSIDMKFFKEMTVGHNVIMGRKTYESLPVTSLPNRCNIVISSTLESGFADAYFSNVKSALDSLSPMYELGEMTDVSLSSIKSYYERDNWFIGGKSIYESSLKYVNEVYITHYDMWYESDTAIKMSDTFINTLKEQFTGKTVFILDDHPITGVVKRYTRKPAVFQWIYNN